jgi:cell division protein FtsB
MQRMQSSSPGTTRRVVGTIAAVAVTASLLAVGGWPAFGAVSWSDVTAAEAEVSQASRQLAEAQAELDALRTERDGLIAAVARLEGREAEIARLAEIEGASIRDRIARMYMTAGASAVHVAATDLSDFATKAAYLGAISERDRELVIQFAVTVTDLEALRLTAEERLAETADLAVAAEATVESRRADLDRSLLRLETVRAEWERFEAAQRAAEEEDLRRQEAEMGGGGTPPTSPPGTSPTTTTTTVPWSPSAGVEQWLPLVTEVFRRWGLTETTCETRNGIQFCVGPQVDAALRVIQCESSGNPMAVNSRSGTAGLFQNHPAFWQDRVNRVRSQHPEKHPDMPADASIFNPEYNIAVAALLVWEGKEVLLGRRGGGGSRGVPWPEFNFDRYYNGSPVAYGYSVWGRGPNPWAHWVGCAATRGVNALGDSGIPYTFPYGQNLYDSGWIHPWARQQTPP